MKLVSGIVGFLIFAVSLPSASQDAKDIARIVFYDKVHPQVACVEINLLKKVELIIGIETAHLIYSSNQFDYKNRNNENFVNQQIRNASISFCNQQRTQQAQTTYAEKQLNEQLKTSLAAYNARIASTQTGGGIRSGAGPGGTGESGLQSGIQLTKEVQGIRKDLGEAEKASAAKPGGPQARGNIEVSNLGEGSGATSVRPTGTTAGLPAKFESGEMTIIPADKSITIPIGEGGAATTFKMNSQTGQFVSSDGNMILSPDEMASMRPPCLTECKAAYDSVASTSSQAAGDLKSIGGAATGMDATSKTLSQQTAAAASDFEFRMEAAYSQLYGTPCAIYAGFIKTATTNYSTQLTACGEKQGTADTFCSVIRSPKAMAVSKLMTLGTAIISQTGSASEGCSAAQKFSTVAQYGMTAANMACTALKYTCDFSCGSAEKSLETVLTTIDTQSKACMAATSYPLTAAYKAVTIRALASMRAIVGAEIPRPTAPKAKLVQCQKYEADILDMGLQVLGSLAAAKQAKACKKALGDGEGGGGGSGNANISMDEFCRVPGQAANPPCKCRTEPTAVGCPGHLASNLNSNNNDGNRPSGNGVNTNNNGGVAALAAPGGLSGFQTGLKKPGSGLSKEAKEALGVSGSTAATDSGAAGMGFAGTGDASGGGDNMGGSGKLGSGASAADAAKKLVAGKSHKFGDFDMSGASFGNLKFGSDGKAIINGKKYSQQEIKVLAARKIASEEFFQQVTTASGKSNWDKVRARYDENRGSLYAP